MNLVTKQQRLIRVSGPSPFVTCTVGGPGRVYVNTAVEPYLATGPDPLNNNQNILVGMWQEDRWANGGAHGLLASYSTDGGSTWNRSSIPPFSACVVPQLPYKRASDPWISIGPDGRVYATAVSLSIAPNGTQVQLSAITTLTSSNGGRTWENFRVIKTDQGPTKRNDKETITADPNQEGLAYVVWDRNADNTASTWFSRTLDGGRSWSKPKIIFNPGTDNETIGNEILVDPHSGVLYNIFSLVLGRTTRNPRIFILIQKSLNKGRTWSSGKVIAEILSVGVIDPVTNQLIRGSGDVLASVTLDSNNGNLYVSWEDSRPSGGKIDEIVISRSTDGGETWSRPARVNPSLGLPCFTPTVRINQSGVVGVSYYIFNSLTHPITTIPINYYFSYSRDFGTTFASSQKITGPFNMLRAPRERREPFSAGLFLGDYQGMTTIGNRFHLFFAKTNPPTHMNRTDIYTTVVNVNGR
ncbi:sialidase family protein [Marininema halotolerans]|uniref:BNR repeat-like domain-containing protein n=1 Tax=Marininema halotolerans TaxID=1155944 RepID=A0A1I6U942_9BACL|nr:sialidase family protein [Marininema halotolerans]SFS97986.1 BNR repeat-like domain-containing protein [Marininema halotolerans]